MGGLGEWVGCIGGEGRGRLGWESSGEGRGEGGREGGRGGGGKEEGRIREEIVVSTL